MTRAGKILCGPQGPVLTYRRLSGEKVEGVKTVRPPVFLLFMGFEMMRKMRNWAVPILLPVVVAGLPAPGVTGFSPCS